MAGYDVTDQRKAKALGLTIMEIEPAEYAIIPVKGPILRFHSSGLEICFGSVFPETGYRHSGAPDFEVYAEGEMDSPDYEMELWIPIVK